ncbi:MAG: ATP-binding cassette domain-containing protein [Candidatus Elarobacter sp.]
MADARVNALLQVRDVRKRFGGVVAVDGLSFDVAPGEFVSIIGPNGAGKTSVFNLITGAYALDGGAIAFDGRPLRGRSVTAISRAGIARTFQTLQIFAGMTTLENVQVPIEARAGGHARARAAELLELVGLSSADGIPADTLSFGAQRLLELARALGAAPRLLLLDEPTSGLSRGEVRSFVDVLRRLREDGLTILMIEHDVATVMAVSDRVVVMHRGAKLAEASPGVVQRDPRVVEAYLGEPASSGTAHTPRTPRAPAPAVLDVRALTTLRGAVRALDGVDVSVQNGEILAIVGPNGAGKSTLLGTIAGWYPPASGSVRLGDAAITGMPAERVVRNGLSLVPERRQMFEELSVRRNLELGAYIHGEASEAAFERVFSLFPRLRERRHQRAGTLSGGEQQMVAIARGILARPRILMLDEPSLGLAPRVVDEIFEALARVNAEGTTIVLVEQNARAAFRIADRVALLERGRIVFTAPAGVARNDPRIVEAYLGEA